MSSSLESTRQYSRQLQDGEWSIQRLIEQHNVDLIRVPGGTNVLGYVRPVPGGYVMALNDRVPEGAIANSIVYHEIAHIVERTTGSAFCLSDMDSARLERDTWFGASLIGLPQGVSRRIIAGTVSAGEIADTYCVPVPFVWLRVGAYVLRHPELFRVDGNQMIANLWFDYFAGWLDSQARSLAA